jgi:hypothetical protein
VRSCADLLVLALLGTVVNGGLNKEVSSLTDAVVMLATMSRSFATAG